MTPEIQGGRKLVVKAVPGKGRGVFATEDIAAGEVFEVCPAIPISREDYRHIAPTVLDQYLFQWREGDAEPYPLALVLGYGSLYNHSSKPNAEIEQIFDRNVVVFTAKTPIRAGEEICFDYECPIWFEVAP